jgi:hypothetical protein
MGCWHRYGACCDWPPPPEWSEVYRRKRRRLPWESDEEWCTEPELKRRRRGSRRGRGHSEEAMRLAILESRARKMREQLEHVESDIERLSSRPDEDDGS